MWTTIRSSSCLWKRTWVKNSRVAGVAEGAVGERLGGLGPGAGLDLVLVDGDGAGGDPGRAGDHPLPAVLDRHDAVALERQVRLVVHAVEALDDRLLDLVDAARSGIAGLGVDAADRVVVDLDLEVLRPAAVAAQPGASGRRSARSSAMPQAAAGRVARTPFRSATSSTMSPMIRLISKSLGV